MPSTGPSRCQSSSEIKPNKKLTISTAIAVTSVRRVRVSPGERGREARGEDEIGIAMFYPRRRRD